MREREIEGNGGERGENIRIHHESLPSDDKR